MPATPSERSAPSIALPCGSRMPDFNVTVTRAFMETLSWASFSRASFSWASAPALPVQNGRCRDATTTTPRGAAHSLSQIDVAINLRQQQRNAERRQFKRIIERLQPLLCESGLTREHDDVD